MNYILRERDKDDEFQHKYHFIKRERETNYDVTQQIQNFSEIKFAIAFGFWLPIRSERSKSIKKYELNCSFNIPSIRHIILVYHFNCLGP